MAVAEEEEVQELEGHEGEVKVEVHPRIHHFRKAGVLRNHRSWRVPEGLVEVKEEGDLITDLEGPEEEGVSLHAVLLSEKYVKFDCNGLIINARKLYTGYKYKRCVAKWSFFSALTRVFYANVALPPRCPDQTHTKAKFF